MRFLLLLLLSVRAFAQDPTANVTIAWDANPEPDILEYRLKIGTEPGVYGQIIKVTAGTQQAITVGKVGFYYAVVTAVNTSGLESLPSDELVFSATGKPPVKPGKPRKL
jgi:hypothetical protein